jgi:enoyl-[acyl-carrier-protein] reductase (NADH)
MEDWMAKGQPIQRAGHPEDIAGMALYLASDDAQWITGQAMVVDGGLTVGSQFLNAGDRGQNPTALPPAGYVGPSFEK